MIEASIKSVQCISPAGLHRMSYKEWGAPDNPNVLVCAHGVTRVADDFDNLHAPWPAITASSAPMWWDAGVRAGWPIRSSTVYRNM